MILANVGIVSYNGYVFDGASNVTVKCEPVYDEAQRAVIYHKYTVTVRTIIAEAQGTDTPMVLIRALLTKPRQALTIQNIGCGGLYVNTAQGVRDVQFGPKPRIVTWEPIGSLMAAEVTWECEACIVYCNGMVAAQGVLALNFSVDYQIDYRFLTTRTIAGYLEIANNSLNNVNAAITDTADLYREQIAPPIPLRFQRVSQSFHLSADKRRLDFTITDQETPSPNPYPSGVVRIDARHRVMWSRRGGGAGYQRNAISVDVEMAPNQPMLNAYTVFKIIADHRLWIARLQNSNSVLLEDIAIEEDIFGRSASFSLVYRIVAPLTSLLTASGLWQPIVTTDWNIWKTSLANVSGVRGAAGLGHLATEDAIIDLCLGNQAIPWGPDIPPAQDEGQGQQTKLQNQQPNPNASWLQYEPAVIVQRDRATVRQAILQAPDAHDQDFNPQDTGGLSYNTIGGINDIVQESGRARYKARLVGKAFRAGYPIPRPALNAVGVAAATETGGVFSCRIVGNWLGVPVYRAAWDIEYALNNAPGSVLPMANLSQGVLADGTSVPVSNV